MVPGALTMDSPCRAASPERGWTSATYPSGSASAMPVGTSARSPGASVTSTVVTRSAPASPGWAYAGSGRSGSSAQQHLDLRRSSASGGGVLGTRAVTLPSGADGDSYDAPRGQRRAAGVLTSGSACRCAGGCRARCWWPACGWPSSSRSPAASPGWSRRWRWRCWRRCCSPTARRGSRRRRRCFRAGRAHIEGRAPRARRAAGRRATRRTAGREADARAYLLLRPYLKRAVRVRDHGPGRPGAVLAGQLAAPRRAGRRAHRPHPSGTAD